MPINRKTATAEIALAGAKWKCETGAFLFFNLAEI